MNHLMLLCVLIVSQLIAFPLRTFAAETGKSEQPGASAADAARAKALLDRAVAYYEKKGDAALTTFTQTKEFVDHEEYVYVLGTDGKFLASGGASAALIGRDVTNLMDAYGKPFFREMLETAKASGSGQVEYRWLNFTDNRVELKVTYFKKVKDRIIAVGYYIPRATAEQAKTLLWNAVKTLEASPKNALATFNEARSQFIQDDLYVFVIDRNDGKFVAHGTMPKLIGSDARKLLDPNGKEIGKAMLDLMQTNETGELDYTWQNPVTKKLENKHTFLQRVSHFIVGVGYYTR